MNVYLVISEELQDVVCEDWSVSACHNEPYCIAEQVRARSRSQAKWLAWKSDKGWSPDVRDMPKFHVYLKAKDVSGQPGLLTETEQRDDWWLDPVTGEEPWEPGIASGAVGAGEGVSDAR